MHFGKSHLEDKREDLRSHYGKIEKTAGVTALRIAFCLLLVVLVCGAGLVIGAVRGVIDSAPDISEANIMPLGNASFIYDADGNQVQKLIGAQGNRVSISIEEIPLDMQHAIVAVEDARFYEHNGSERYHPCFRCRRQPRLSFYRGRQHDHTAALKKQCFH